MFLVASLFLYSQLNFYNEYFYNYPLYSAKDWQFGYKQVALISQKYQDQVDQVKITSYYGQPYLFFAFYQSRNPLLVLWGEMSHDDYLFPDKIDWDGEQFSQNTLLIGSPQEIPAHIPENVGNLVTQVHYPDQEVVFRIVKTN